MAETVKDISTRIDAVVEKIDNKIEDLLKMRNADSVVMGAAQTDIAGLKATIANASLGTLQTDVASLKTTISNAKWLGATASVVIALLGSVGVWQIVKTQLEVSQERAEFKDLRARAADLIVSHAGMMKEALIDKIEMELNSEASLDLLRGKPQLNKIKANAKELESVNSKLPPNMRTNYFKISNALDAFLADNWVEVLRILDQIDSGDQQYFGFAYMQGASYLRTNKPELARQSFGRAAKLTEGKRVQMTLNAQGVSNLALWKALKATKPVEAKDALSAAILQFENLKVSYPAYAAAFLNLACAYSAQENFAKTSEVLSELRTFQSPELIAQQIQEDMTRATEEFMTVYVREELKVVISPNDQLWKQQVVSKLPSAKF